MPTDAELAIRKDPKFGLAVKVNKKLNALQPLIHNTDGSVSANLHPNVYVASKKKKLEKKLKRLKKHLERVSKRGY